MLAEAAPEVIRGSKAIDFNGYVVYVVQGDLYVKNRETLVETISDIKSEVYLEDRNIVKADIDKDLVPLYDLQTPPADRLEAIERRATIMLAAEHKNPYVFIGAATAREVAIRTWQGYEDLLWETRAVKEGHRRLGLGKFFFQETLAFHHQANMIAIRTQSPAAIWSAREAGVFQEGRLFPLDVRYGKDPRMQEVMMQLYYRFRRNALVPPYPDTGVVRGEYLKENIAYELDEEHAPTKEIYDRMVGEFKMNFQKGDAMYLVGYAA